MLKILHVTGSYLPENGGTIQRIHNLSLPLVKNKLCEIHVITSKRRFQEEQRTNISNLSDEEIIEGIKVHRVENFNNLFGAIRRVVLQNDIDLIHTHNPRFDFFCFITNIQKPIVAEIHTIRQLTLFKFQLTKIVYQRSNKIICLSQNMKKTIVKQYKLPFEKIEIIYNGVNVERFNFEGNKHNTIRIHYHIKEPLIIGYIGTFYHWQGGQDLVKAFSILVKKRNDIRLLLVGSGLDLEKIKKLINDLKITQKVTMPGMISANLLADYYNAIDVFVIPRPSTIETETALPLKILESMAAGKAIVATKVGGLAEVVENGFNGIFCSPNSPEELGEAINCLLDSENLRIKLGENARNTVKEKFTWENSSTKLFKLYQNICKD